MSARASRVTLSLPDDWTPEQALAVYELLTELAEIVWNHYEIALIELLSPELNQDDASLKTLLLLVLITPPSKVIPPVGLMWECRLDPSQNILGNCRCNNLRDNTVAVSSPLWDDL